MGASGAPASDPLRLLDRRLRAQLRRSDQPTRVEPQLASSVPGDPPAGWWYERKYDGVRMLAFVRGGDARLRTRKHVPVDDAFPELIAALQRSVGRDVVVDGEVVAEDGEAGAYARLQGRLGLGLMGRGRVRPETASSRGGALAAGRPPVRTPVPVQLHLFDLLHLDGHDLRQLPLSARRELLEATVDFAGPVRFSPHRKGRARDLLPEACRSGWEGLIAKDPLAPYLAGRSRRWRKLACVRGQQLVVGGYTEPSGARTGFGALLLGYHDAEGRLRYAGKVGSGFEQTTIAALGPLLHTLGRVEAPFVDPPADRDAHWVDPHVVVQVSFAEWTEAGRLRNPRFDSLRIDLDPAEVIREPLG